MTAGPLRELLSRHLRQQAEIGGGAVVFERWTREEALSAASSRAAAERPSATPPGQPGGAAGSSSGSVRARPGPDPGRAEVSETYAALRAEALQCERCALAKTRTHVVFSDGNPAARLMVVGEAPGAQEDRTGLAFVGPAGKLLDLLLATVGLSRSTSAYICNVLKCRPPGNRNPLPVEIEACTPFLRRQIEVVMPEAILAVGTFAAQFLTGRGEALGKLRGEVHNYQGVPVVASYHPAALLRNPAWTRATWNDLQLLRQVLDGA